MQKSQKLDFFLIGLETIRMICAVPLVVVDFSLHFCLRNEQRIHTRAL